MEFQRNNLTEDKPSLIHRYIYKCVGLVYYCGEVTDNMKLVRDNDNAVDDNAIQVNTDVNKMVGFLEKSVLEKLAPIMDTFDDREVWKKNMCEG